jgi:hypothetical protein
MTVNPALVLLVAGLLLVPASGSAQSPKSAQGEPSPRAQIQSAEQSLRGRKQFRLVVKVDEDTTRLVGRGPSRHALELQLRQAGIRVAPRTENVEQIHGVGEDELPLAIIEMRFTAVGLHPSGFIAWMSEISVSDWFQMRVDDVYTVATLFDRSSLGLIHESKHASQMDDALSRQVTQLLNMYLTVNPKP